MKSGVDYTFRLAKRGMRSMRRRLSGGNSPGLFIVGAQKAGTSSLFNYLATVPGFQGAQFKEVHFFDRPELHKKGHDWYERFFLGSDSSSLFYEATPSYLYYPDVPRLIHEYNPRAKIVVMLRDPVARAYSAWNMYYQLALKGPAPIRMRRRLASGDISPVYELFFTKVPPSFSEYIKYEQTLMEKGDDAPFEPSIIRRGFYRTQIERYFDYFEREQVKVIGFGDFAHAPYDVTVDVSRFARPDASEPTMTRTPPAANKRAYSTPILAEDRAVLEALYERENAGLWECLGHSVNW